MATFIKDIDHIILSKLNNIDLLNFLQAIEINQYGKKLGNDEIFWKNRFLKQFGDFDKNSKRTWQNSFLKMVYYKNKSSSFRNKQLFENNKENSDFIKYFNSHLFNHKYDYNYLNITEYKITPDIDISNSMMNKRNIKDIIDFFLKNNIYLWTGYDKELSFKHSYLHNFQIIKTEENWYGVLIFENFDIYFRRNLRKEDKSC